MDKAGRKGRRGIIGEYEGNGVPALAGGQRSENDGTVACPFCDDGDCAIEVEAYYEADFYETVSDDGNRRACWDAKDAPVVQADLQVSDDDGQTVRRLASPSEVRGNHLGATAWVSQL
jgi:hypothetical protein